MCVCVYVYVCVCLYVCMRICTFDCLFVCLFIVLKYTIVVYTYLIHRLTAWGEPVGWYN